MHRVKAFLVWLLFIRLVFLLAPLLLFVARTWRGRLEGVFGVVCGVLVGGGGFWLWRVAHGRPTPDEVRYVVIAFGVAFLPLCLLASFLCRKYTFGEGPVGSHHLLSEPNPDTAGWGDVEDDYAWLLTVLVTRFDPWMPSAEAKAARAAVAQLVDEVSTHPDYRGLARGGASHRLMRGRLDPEHCYSYRPPGTDERFGLLVFLHGHGLNYLILLHALRPLCDELRLVLVCPTFGYGNWEAPGGVAAIERASKFAREAFPIDPRRTILAGFSQGGAGVGRAAADFAGLIFISGTMELDVLSAGAWHGRPVLVIQGDRDHNVTPRSVAAGVEVMQANGAVVTTHSDPDAGHFLFFAQLDEVRRAVAAWAKKIAAR